MFDSYRYMVWTRKRVLKPHVIRGGGVSKSAQMEPQGECFGGPKVPSREMDMRGRSLRLDLDGDGRSVGSPHGPSFV